MYLGLSEVTFDIADGKRWLLAIQRMTELLTLLLVPGDHQNRFRRSGT